MPCLKCAERCIVTCCLVALAGGVPLYVNELVAKIVQSTQPQGEGAEGAQPSTEAEKKEEGKGSEDAVLAAMEGWSLMKSREMAKLMSRHHNSLHHAEQEELRRFVP